MERVMGSVPIKLFENLGEFCQYGPGDWRHSHNDSYLRIIQAVKNKERHIYIDYRRGLDW
jgi:hypothetical protein